MSDLTSLRAKITKCFGDTKMPEDDQFEPDVELFDIEATIDRLEAIVAQEVLRELREIPPFKDAHKLNLYINTRVHSLTRTPPLSGEEDP